MTVQFRFIEHYGDIKYIREKWVTFNEHWIVNGHKFYTYPTDEQIEEAYKEKPKD